ncbi:hypothetical protein GCM10022218_12330 [Sphingobacterium ginsenosidimutans]|uniref:Uncharacterized protein n=1 Tax=Sphingobacterium ginsenosidimutans TaxID=687845 RepID=A0ABP7ZVW4_9SPHI
MKEKIIDAIMTQNGSSDRSVIKHRIEYGYKFFTPLNSDDKLTALKPAAEELKDMTVKEDLVMNGRKKCTSGKIRTTDPNCWLESTIGRIWIQFHNGSKEVASQHFSMLLDGLDEVDDIAFTSGLVGIGFGIESLSQRHILDIDSNIVLEDFDNLFYSSYLFGNKEEIGLHNGMAGKLLYLSLRNRNQNSHKNTHRFRSLIHHECLQLILDQIVGYWPLPKIALEKYAMIDICQLMIIFSSIATHEKISSGSLLRIIENYSFYFLAMFNKASNEISLETGCCSYLLWQCNKIVGDLYFMGHFSEQYAKFSSQLLCNGQENFGILAFDKEAIFQYLDGHTASHFRKLEVELKNTVFLKLMYNAV